MSRTVRVVVVVATVQVIVIAAYWLVERNRSPDQESPSALSTQPPQRVDGKVERLRLHHRSGNPLDLAALERPTLVHVWATWCPPCRDELPSFLALPQQHRVDIAAIALDRNWSDVDAFLRGLDSSNVFLGDAADIERVFGVRSLPVTFLVETGGRLRLRFDGARDWNNSDFLKTWIEVAERE